MEHILIIDDEESIRHLLKRILEREGFIITEASNGAEGIKCYNENPIDLVITDIFMPEKEGLETIRELKKQNPDIKILAMSGGRNEQNFYMAKKFGALETIEKPIQNDFLLETVRAFL